MKKFILTFNMLMVFAVVGYARQQEDTILQRYQRFLFSQGFVAQHVEQWMGTIGINGRWPDINYQDNSPAAWQLWNHLKRLDTLALAWAKPNSPFYHNKKVWHTIQLALNDWLKNKYQNPNWWHNQIGVPQGMRDVIVLLQDNLSADELREALKVMAQFHVQGAGANLTWSADLGLHYGALVHDTALIDSCRRLIVGEVHISRGEGIQPDYSFHQHGGRLQMFQYGKAFLFTNVRIAWELAGTRWAFPAAKIDMLTNFVLKGWQWMARGINTVPGTMDRSASRKGELRSPDIRKLIDLICELDPGKTRAFRTLAAHQDGNGSVHGFRYFPYSDFAAYQNDKFSFFLKTISTRTLPSEVGLNGENLKGRLLNSGDAYLISNGNEYYNLMPVWDWKKLPGITAWKSAYKIDRKPFAGSVSDGNSGLTAMDYAIENQTGEQGITAHKVWACHKNMVVCLISNLRTDHVTDTVYTVLDQCRLQGKVVIGGAGHLMQDDDQCFSQLRWIWHHGFAYIPLHPGIVKIQAGISTGSWLSISSSASGYRIEDSVFMPLMLHDKADAGQPTGYVLAYCKTAQQAANLYQKPGWRIIRNDEICQAVRFSDGTVMAAFFSPGQLKLGKYVLDVNRPCLLQVDKDRLFISDPLHKGSAIDIKFRNRLIRTEMAADGTTKTISLK